MSRITEAIRAANARGRKALGIFMTCGFPEPAATDLLLDAIVDGGADFIELGMPFSDPLAEGLPIQEASARALAAGASLQSTLEAARRFRTRHATPNVLMGYLNPVLRFGAPAFFAAAREAGVDGIILPDLPPSERHLVADAAAENDIDLIHLIAPNTSEERVRSIDDLSSGFVYAVSVTGLTGTGLGSVEAVGRYLERARTLVVRNPLLVGFGISNREDAERLSEHTDGFIVGSAAIRTAERLWDDPERSPADVAAGLSAFVRGLRAD